MAKEYQTGVRLNKKGKPSIIHWRGLLCDFGRRQRVLTFIGIIIVIGSLCFTQLGFVGVGAQGSYVGYCITLLAPIALSGLLLGTMPCTLTGLLSGALLLAHSLLQPIDYYEMNFITPVSSILLFTIAGFFIGLFLAIALRKNPSLRRRIIYFALISVITSLMFTVTFTLYVILQIGVQLVQLALESGITLDEETVRQYAFTMTRFGSFTVQVWLDAAIMLITCIVGELAVRKFEATKSDIKLATKFRTQLLLVVLLAFMMTAGMGYVVITEQSKGSANEKMHDEISYLSSQLQGYDSRIDSLNAFLAIDAKSEKAVSETEEAELRKVFSIDSLLEGYSKESDGTIVVFSQGKVLLSDDSCFPQGASFDDYIMSTVVETYAQDPMLSANEMFQISYDEQILTKNDVAAAETLTFTASTQMVFGCVGVCNDYLIMILQPAPKVFANRDATMGWISISAFVLLTVVSLLVSRLLSVIVVRRIDEVNGVLGEITKGDLTARVDIRDSREFASLSRDVNATVDALKGWIAEAEQRMDAELSTAKAIQESALPRIFPPFPDILKFDVYAIMNAAREVGGDFYDFFLIGDDAGSDSGKLGFVVADVSGKGVPAALFMMKAKTQLRDYLASGMEPGEAVENANRQLCDGNDGGMFVTAWVGVLDYATGHVDYVNAGHNPPLLWSVAEVDEGSSDEHPVKGSWLWLTEKSGMPLGLFDGFPYEAYSLDCRIGDQFLLYSDGVTEAMSVDGELYGEDRLIEIATADFAYHPRALVDAVRRDVARHAQGAEQSDDITILALEVGVPPEVTATIAVPADDAKLPDVIEFIHTELDRRLCPLRAQKQLDIAVEELFVNVCHYAFGERNTSGGMVLIGYTYSADPPSVKITISDEGVPYNPLAKPDAVTPDDIMEVPIGGLGILMAKKSVDEMAYERIDGRNIVTIVKKW